MYMTICSVLQTKALNVDYDNLKKAHEELQRTKVIQEDENMYLHNEMDQMTKEAEIRYMQEMATLYTGISAFMVFMFRPKNKFIVYTLCVFISNKT